MTPEQIKEEIAKVRRNLDSRFLGSYIDGLLPKLEKEIGRLREELKTAEKDYIELNDAYKRTRLALAAKHEELKKEKDGHAITAKQFVDIQAVCGSLEFKLKAAEARAEQAELKLFQAGVE